jgi:hypothetical protein
MCLLARRAFTPGSLECAETRAGRGCSGARTRSKKKPRRLGRGKFGRATRDHDAPQDPSCHDSVVDGDTSANALVEIDNLAPIHPGIDISDCPASGALEMSADVAPIPIRQFLQRESAAVSANPALGRAHAIYENGTKARVMVDGAFPIPKPWCWFATPGHRRRTPLRLPRKARDHIRFAPDRRRNGRCSKRKCGEHPGCRATLSLNSITPVRLHQ